jgi:hypothetical protein
MRYTGLSQESREKAEAWAQVHDDTVSIGGRTRAAEDILELWYYRSLRQFRRSKRRGNRPHPDWKKYFAIILGRVEPKFPAVVQAALITRYGSDRSNPSRYHCFFEGILL